MNDSLLAELSAPGATLTRTIEAVERLEALISPRRDLNIGISSNVSIDLLSTFLRKQALLVGVRLTAHMGGHDDVLNDAERFAASGADSMIYLPFFDNLLPAFEYHLETVRAEELAEQETDFRNRCAVAFRAAETIPAVYVGTLHRYGRAVDIGQADAVALSLDRFNTALREEAAVFPNVRLIDTTSIVEAIGTEGSFDRRFYLRSTAPYTTAYFDELARRISLASRGFGTYFYKALVLDCDNTLWGGIVGEDLLEGLQLDPHSYPGRVYWQAQRAFAALERNGVLLCLCSKNNPQDVDEVFDRHPHMALTPESIAIKKVNWTDKVTNLRQISAELNIGLDSLVFLDDSDFECAAVRAALPQVRVLQVPGVLPEYGRVLRELRELFLAGGISNESRSKTEQYRRVQAASKEQAQFASREEYLAALDLRVEIKKNSVVDIQRISELTQKSNQFNVTTLRQSPATISVRMSSPGGCVYSLFVSDKFGSAGLTGVAIMSWSCETARVEAFLMSCRVIGRGVEFSIWSHLAADASRNGCRFLEAEYRATPKNTQVADFYDQLGLELISTSDGVKCYRIPLDNFSPPEAGWIKVIYGQ